MATNQGSDTRTKGTADRAADAYETARERTSDAYRAARERAGEYGGKVGEQLTANPMAAIFGGLAVGALLGALLPVTRREQELLGDYGHKLTDAARDAARSAAEAGREQIDEITGKAVTQVGSAVVDAVAGKS
jgi:ElaB/YqjD/DUF883 family membrane-anchored ribosome-binding protein